LRPDLLADLRSRRTMTVQLTMNTRRGLTLTLPLEGFGKAHDGPPVDPRALQAQQRRL